MAWPVNRHPYYIAFSGFMGGPIGRMLIRRYNYFAGTMMRRLLGDKSKLSEAAHKQYLRALPTPDDCQGFLALAKQIVASTPWLGRLWDNVSLLTAKPTLIVCGMKDVAFGEKELKRWQSRFLAARSIHLSSVGHFVQEEAPGQLAEAVASSLGQTAPAWYRPTER